MKLRRINSLLGLCFGLLLAPLLSAQVSQSTDSYQVPRDEFGYPDLNGVWNFNDSTPFERPARYGEQEFLSAEEVAAKFNRLETSQERRDQREQDVAQRVMEVPTDDTGAYNLFWSYYDEPFPNTRTSMIIYPRDGRIPTTQNGVIT